MAGRPKLRCIAASPAATVAVSAWNRGKMNEATPGRSPPGKHQRVSMSSSRCGQAWPPTSGNSIMRKALIVAAAAILAVAGTLSEPAHADGRGGAVAAGVLGGLAVAAIVRGGWAPTRVF